jgi:uncharacterized repeat protein (TIGR02543 family)
LFEVINSNDNTATRKIVAAVAAVGLSISGLISLSIPAHATTPFAVFYNGNLIGTSVPASETQIRGTGFALPAATSVTGSRTGYTFGGWSLTSGGAAVANPYSYSSDASRVDLYAVWTTTVNYNTNGETSGSLSGSKTSDVYRFGQELELPTVGTLARTGFEFGGWMSASISTNRRTSYVAANLDTGNPTMYAAWIKTVTFNSNFASTGTPPASLTYVAGGERLKLPTSSEMTLRRSGYSFAGWATSATGTPISNPTSFEPLVSRQTLYAIWKVQSTKATTRVFFEPGKSILRASQKLVLRDLVDKIRGASAVQITLSATRPKSAPFSLGKARNKAVAAYFEAQGLTPTFSRTNTVGKGRLASAQKNNRVSLDSSWVNPTN